MTDEQFHLLRARLESLLHGGELTGLQAMRLKTIIKAHIIPSPDPVTVYTALGAPDGYDVGPGAEATRTGTTLAPAPKPPGKRRGRPPGSTKKSGHLKLKPPPKGKPGPKPKKGGRRG